PLLIGSVVAHAFTVLTLNRSILTEKVARRGYHLSREYGVDPLEILFAHEVMRTSVAVLPANSTVGDVHASLNGEHRQKQRLLPVVNEDGTLAGVLTRKDFRDRIHQDGEASLQLRLGELVRSNAARVFADEPLRVVVYRMAEKGFTRMPVLDRVNGRFLGLISLDDLLKARTRHLEEERRRERILQFNFFRSGNNAATEKNMPVTS
ncbi:MAG TPA: CBS domain-containing protein, partial [Candidatus Acidoferrum sp.]